MGRWRRRWAGQARHTPAGHVRMQTLITPPTEGKKYVRPDLIMHVRETAARVRATSEFWPAHATLSSFPLPGRVAGWTGSPHARWSRSDADATHGREKVRPTGSDRLLSGVRHVFILVVLDYQEIFLHCCSCILNSLHSREESGTFKDYTNDKTFPR